nr:dTMP kinase [Kineosporia mesophila]
MAALLAVGLGACGGVAWNTGHTLLGLAVDDSVRSRTFSFLAAASRVVLLLVLALGPVLAAVIGRHTIHFTDSRTLSYNGAAFVFLIAAVLVVALGLAAYRRLDDRPGTGLLQELRALRSSRGPRPADAPRPTYPGVFVALEGGDGSGKSTQARLLGDWLRSDQGHDVVLTREPGATPAGVRLREVLLSNGSDLGNRAEALLFAADRAHHVEAVVRPALERGAIVVTDRYIDSSVAYQGAGRELDGDEVLRLSQWATDDLVPALTVLLDVDPVISKVRRARDASRGGEDRLESLADDFHDRVRAEFLALARRAPHRYLVVDAGLGADQVQQLIRERVRQVLPVSARRRAELNERLADEDQSRERRASAEAEVLRMDADLRRRRVEEAREREESRRRARDEAERQLQEEAERELRAQESRRNREEVDRRASEAAAAATLGPVTEPVQMPGRYPGHRVAEPPTDPLTGHLPVQEPVQEPIQESFEPQEQDLWAPPADLTQPVQTPQAQPYETFESYEGETNPVPQGPPPSEPSDPQYQPEQDLQAPPHTVYLPDDDQADDRTIVLLDSENSPETGPLRRRGRRQT